MYIRCKCGKTDSLGASCANQQSNTDASTSDHWISGHNNKRRQVRGDSTQCLPFTILLFNQFSNLKEDLLDCCRLVMLTVFEIHVILLMCCIESVHMKSARIT